FAILTSSFYFVSHSHSRHLPYSHFRSHFHRTFPELFLSKVNRTLTPTPPTLPPPPMNPPPILSSGRSRTPSTASSSASPPPIGSLSSPDHPTGSLLLDLTLVPTVSCSSSRSSLIL
ncbi:hypothetical protein LINPERPRIM_LOCUS22114, partial [Linum perenne]